jgi:hypothetical protein
LAENTSDVYQDKHQPKYLFTQRSFSNHGFGFWAFLLESLESVVEDSAAHLADLSLIALNLIFIDCGIG